MRKRENAKGERKKHSHKNFTRFVNKFTTFVGPATSFRYTCMCVMWVCVNLSAIPLFFVSLSPALAQYTVVLYAFQLWFKFHNLCVNFTVRVGNLLQASLSNFILVICMQYSVACSIVCTLRK